MSNFAPLRLYAYALTGSGTGHKDYGDFIEDLDFSTIAPGGFGDLTCHLKVPNARLIPYELRMMARMALMGSDFPAFLGRWDEPAIVLSDSDGDVMELHAMGAAHCFKDDPTDSAYSNKTAQFIIGQEISSRSAYLPLDPDATQLLPDNPSATFSPAFNTKDIEEKINELSPLLGDYQWAVWDHPRNRDAEGFPTWQVFWHKRDTTTISYTGYLRDENSYSIRPTVEYTYNVVQIKYRDSGNNDAPASVTVKDSRLNPDNSQGSAPFPYRKLVKDLSYTHLSSTQAAFIANALLAQYENGGFKVEVDLAAVYDDKGNPIPLWQVRSDRNIALPEMAPIGTQIALTNTPNTNVFYIQETRYSEASGAAPKLTLAADSFYDRASFQIARMQYHHEARQKDARHHHTLRAAGEPEVGQTSVGWGANALAGDIWSVGCNFKTNLSAAPTSVGLTLIDSVNCSGVSYAALTNNGFEFQATVAANGAGRARATYTTVGN